MFRYKKTVTEITVSFWPILAVVIVVLWIMSDHSAIAAVGNGIVTLLEWVAISVGIAIVLIVAFTARAVRNSRTMIKRPARQDIPVNTVRLYPTLEMDSKPEIEPTRAEVVSVNGIPIEQYMKMKNSSQYGRKVK